jgi:hypothetical protein
MMAGTVLVGRVELMVPGLITSVTVDKYQNFSKGVGMEPLVLVTQFSIRVLGQQLDKCATFQFSLIQFPASIGLTNV